MYEYIAGRVSELTPAYAVLDARGVGYYLNISLHTFSALGSAAEAKLYTHFIVREDAQILYGFSDRAERELFRLLIGVSGVGGNTARMILSTFPPDELGAIISTGKAEVLKS
ncbi:MAG: Holliday junction branch migration protein RuvA, partial [Rikenellaceae bacterium]|nr:Holliday junction branch migration protein RuvA [Rikenellaceae bacterium]